MTTIGLIGAGHIGSQLARLGVQHGYQVVLSNSRGPQTLVDLVAELGPNARAATPAEAAAAADIAVVTVPLRSVTQLPAAELAGKVVIDTCNYYPHRDGQIAVLDSESTTTSEFVASHLPGAKVVKACNHIRAAALTAEAQPAGTPGRRALAIAGDDPAAKSIVAQLLDEFGFDVVDIGPLSAGWRTQRDTPAYVTRLTAPELRAAVGRARRYRDM